MDWLAEDWLVIASLVLIATGIWWRMPQTTPRLNMMGLLLALAGTVMLVVRIDAAAVWGETILFWLFAAAAIVAAVLMITSRNPVYSALWFALATLGTCGLFLLQYAPFLAAATVIVYAGAIVVTFVFVIMLAQQSGAAIYDQRARQPLAATLATFVLLAAVLGALQSGVDRTDQNQPEIPAPPPLLRVTTAVPEEERAGEPVAAAANPLSSPVANEPLSSIDALGRSLFGDYLYAVELAGTLLLVATIGAIAIAPRRRRGTL